MRILTLLLIALVITGCGGGAGKSPVGSLADKTQIAQTGADSGSPPPPPGWTGGQGADTPPSPPAWDPDSDTPPPPPPISGTGDAIPSGDDSDLPPPPPSL